jgi:hypothetical protein
MALAKLSGEKGHGPAAVPHRRRVYGIAGGEALRLPTATGRAYSPADGRRSDGARNPLGNLVARRARRRAAALYADVTGGITDAE